MTYYRINISVLLL